MAGLSYVWQCMISVVVPCVDCLVFFLILVLRCLVFSGVLRCKTLITLCEPYTCQTLGSEISWSLGIASLQLQQCFDVPERV